MVTGCASDNAHADSRFHANPDILHRPQSSAEFNRASEDRDQLFQQCECFRASVKSRVKIHYVQPFCAEISPLLCHVQRVTIYRHIITLPLTQTDRLAVHQVNGRIQIHRITSQSRLPFVDRTPSMRGSKAAACLNASPNALKRASIL